jgi:biotin carboxylase
LLAVEARKLGDYYDSRYRQVEDLGAQLFVLCGEGRPDAWATDRYRITGSKRLADLIDHALRWHAEVGFDGVLTFAETSVVATAAIAEALGLPGIGSAAALTSRNKLVMRQAHERGDVPRPRFRFVTDLAGAEATAAEFGYPVILKPTLGAASNFVFRADDPETLRLRFGQASAGIDEMQPFTHEAEGVDLGPHGLLVESYLEGDEHLIEALAWDDEVYLGSVVDRVTAESSTFDDDMHAAPTSLTLDQLIEVHAVVRAGARAQGLHRSVMHAEIRFHHGHPHVLEIAARPGGGGLDHMARLTAGYCPIRATMDVARGVRPQVRHYQPTGVYAAASVLLCGPGVVASIEVPDEVRSDPAVWFLKITAQPGTVILRPPDGNSIVGFIGTNGSSRAAALDSMIRLGDQVRVTLTSLDATPMEAGR